jgi:membrane-associated phospholipid phosphatase
MISSTKQDLSRSERLARWLSTIFHPFPVSVVTLVLVLYLDGATWTEALLWTAVGFAIVIVPLTIFLGVNVQRGRYSDWSLSIREERQTIFILTGICFAILVLTFIWAGAPTIALACLYAALATVVMAAGINRLVTKISLHAIAVAGCAAALYWVAPPLGLLLAVAGIAVSWSRMALKHHTLAQIVLGWGVAVGSVVVVFTLYLLG